MFDKLTFPWIFSLYDFDLCYARSTLSFHAWKHLYCDADQCKAQILFLTKPHPHLLETILPHLGVIITMTITIKHQQAPKPQEDGASALYSLYIPVTVLAEAFKKPFMKSLTFPEDAYLSPQHHIHPRGNESPWYSCTPCSLWSYVVPCISAHSDISDSLSTPGLAWGGKMSW